MRARAYAKINLGLVVGPLRADGKHEIATVLERVDLHDVIELERGDRAGVTVEGFTGDTLVRRALELLGEATQSPPRWRVRIEKRIPVASGMGGGSSDAATTLRLANEISGDRLSPAELHRLAAAIGSDVPFFLTSGAKLATGDGTELEPVELPREYWVLLCLPRDTRKQSTAAVYEAVDAAAASREFEGRRAQLLDAVRKARDLRDLADLSRNELARVDDSALGAELAKLGAFRVDTSGAGPTIYGLFDDEAVARRAEQTLRSSASTRLARPVLGP